MEKNFLSKIFGVVKNDFCLYENLPCRVSIEILNEKCKILRIFRNLEIHLFNVVDVRGSPLGITRHLVRVPVEHLAKFSKRVDARMRNSVRVGEEIVAWFETDGCDVCNTIVSRERF